jgi:hypothetical protein
MIPLSNCISAQAASLYNSIFTKENLTLENLCFAVPIVGEIYFIAISIFESCTLSTPSSRQELDLISKPIHERSFTFVCIKILSSLCINVFSIMPLYATLFIIDAELKLFIPTLGALIFPPIYIKFVVEDCLRQKSSDPVLQQ